MIRQPHLEGMLSHEYSLLLKTLHKLQVSQVNVYFDAAAVSNPELVGQIVDIGGYFNKRFYKLTEEHFD